MVNNLYRARVTDLIERAKQKGLVKTYSQYCKTEDGKKTAMTKDETNYYTSRDKGDAK